MRKQRKNRKRLILGITGSFASGKTTVAKMFAASKAKLIDADKIAHALIRRTSPAYRKIVAGFGNDILNKEGEINRRKLAGIVFNNKQSLKKLNDIVHPRVIKVIKKQIDCAKEKLIILDVPLLIESGLETIADKIIVVKTSKDKQLARAIKSTSLKRVDILKRIRSQVPLHVKLRFADFIIDNSGTIARTKKQVMQIRRLLWKN